MWCSLSSETKSEHGILNQVRRFIQDAGSHINVFGGVSQDGQRIDNLYHADPDSADATSIASRSSAPMPGPSIEPRNTSVPSPIFFLIHTECFPNLARASLWSHRTGVMASEVRTRRG